MNRIKTPRQSDTAPAYGMILAGLKEPFRSETLLLNANGEIVEQYHCGGPANMLPQGAEFLLAPKS